MDGISIMRKKLVYKFILIYVLIGVGGFILLSTLGSTLIENRIINYESKNLYNEASNIAADDSLFSTLTTKSAGLKELYRSLSKIAVYQDCQIWLINPQGRIYINTAVPFEDMSSKNLEGFDPVALGSDYYSVGTFFDAFTDDYLTVMVPMAANLDIRGYVAIHRPMSKLKALREDVLGNMHLIALLMLAVILSVFLLLYFSVLRPLRLITNGTRKYIEGDLAYNIPVNSSDEFGELASSLNFMSDELNKSSIYEKQFLANVSHDFRSPLTSIKGFVEAILDGTIPPEMQERYLRIVLGETERLTKLTNGILSLNNMEQKRFQLNLSDFDINAVIRTTAATFEGICRPRQISIKLLLTGEQLFVHADIEKIQQVLYNLIDNAIKFSRDDSTIEINSDVRHDKIFISVEDHGAGIPSASLNKIWERFYKTDTSRGKERKGNGLGLAIVKEIINQHNQNITVISTENVGTEFVFSLDAAKENL
jgi:signal transduction histidine kinase